MGEDRRRVPRYSAHVKATLKLPGESATVSVMVEDICVLGCLLEYGLGLEPHQECEFFLSWKGRDFHSPATVAWRGDQGQVGMEFHGTDSENHQKLREICAELLMKPLLRLSSRDEQHI